MHIRVLRPTLEGVLRSPFGGGGSFFGIFEIVAFSASLDDIIFLGFYVWRGLSRPQFGNFEWEMGISLDFL